MTDEDGNKLNNDTYAMGVSEKEYWDNVDELAMAVQGESVPVRAKTIVLNVTDMPHSLSGRLAGPGTDWKLYGKSVQHLAEQVRELSEHPDIPLALELMKKRYSEQKESK